MLNENITSSGLIFSSFEKGNNLPGQLAIETWGGLCDLGDAVVVVVFIVWNHLS